MEEPLVGKPFCAGCLNPLSRTKTRVEVTISVLGVGKVTHTFGSINCAVKHLDELQEKAHGERAANQMEAPR